MNKEEFIIEIKKLGITLSTEMLIKLERYYETLVEWNNKINLTTIIKKEDVYLKHFYDSLTLVKVLNFNEIKTVCDFGTGAGLPGIVLAIVFPKTKFILVDSIRKKTIFLEDVKNILKLENVEIINDRVENIKDKKVELIVSRAAGKTKDILKFSLPILDKNGKIALMKAKDLQIDSKWDFESLGLRKINFIDFLLPIEGSERKIIVFQK